MGTAVVPFARGRAVARISAANLPSTIANGIFDVLTAFAAGPQQDDADKKRLVRIYGEAVAGFDVAVAEHAIGWLKLHNPRNPFRPTPQDVYETCEKLLDAWRERVLDHFTGRGTAQWGSAPDRSYGLTPKFPWGAEPFTPGAIIPDVLAKSFLRDYFDYRYGPANRAADLGRDRLAAIPADCFMEGQLAAALGILEERERHQAEIAKHDAYLETLDADLRRHRRVVLNTGDNNKLSEEELIAEAKKALERERRSKVEAEEAHKRRLADGKPEVRAIIERMQDAIKRGEEESRQALVAEYIAALAKHGAKPPAHLANARGVDP